MPTTITGALRPAPTLTDTPSPTDPTPSSSTTTTTGITTTTGTSPTSDTASARLDRPGVGGDRSHGGAMPAVAPAVGRGPRSRPPVFVGAVVLLAVAFLCTASAPAAAQEGGGSVAVLAQAESVDQVLTNIRNWLMGILAGLATVMATIGGIRYTMADGDPGEVQRAKTALRSAGIGFALAALAPLLVTVLQGLVGL